jgi:hypothetical protein
VRSSGPAVDLDDVRVGQVTGKEEPERKRSILAFASAGSPEDEVVSLFVKSCLLEVILLTEDGRPTSALAGIVAQWGAASTRRERGGPAAGLVGSGDQHGKVAGLPGADSRPKNSPYSPQNPVSGR